MHVHNVLGQFRSIRYVMGCCADAQSYFPDYVDRALRLTAYWADCQLRMGEGITAARTVWEDALKTSTGRCAVLFPPASTLRH